MHFHQLFVNLIFKFFDLYDAIGTQEVPPGRVWAHFRLEARLHGLRLHFTCHAPNLTRVDYRTEFIEFRTRQDR